MKKIFTLLAAAVVGACAASAQSVVESWSDATYLGLDGNEVTCTVNLLDNGNYQIVNPYEVGYHGNVYYYPITLTLKVNEDNQLEFVNSDGSQGYVYDYTDEGYIFVYYGYDWSTYQWAGYEYIYLGEYSSFSNEPIARRPWVDMLTWYAYKDENNYGYVSVKFNNRGVIDSIDNEAKVGLQRVENNEEEDILTAEAAYHQVTVYNMSDGSAYVFNPFGTGEEADVLHFTVSDIEDYSDAEWPYLAKKGYVEFDNLSGSGKNARYITLDEVSYYVLDSKSNSEKYAYYRFEGEPRTGVSYWADEIHFRINLRNEKVEGASIAPAILHLVYNLEEKAWGVNSSEPAILRLGDDETTDRDIDVVIYDNRDLEVDNVFGEGYTDDNFIFKVVNGKLSVQSFDGLNEYGEKTWTVKDAEGNDVVVTFNERRSYFGKNATPVEGTAVVDGVEREGKFTEWAYVYTEPFGFIDIFMGFESDPYIVESYDAYVEVSNSSTYELYVANETTIDEWSNGEYTITNFLGEPYEGDLKFEMTPIDGLDGYYRFNLLDTEEYWGYKYMNIWNSETEAYIQPYVYDGEYSIIYYEDPIEYMNGTWAHWGFFQLYDETWSYCYVYVLWDFTADGTTSIVNVEASTDDAPAVYYNLNGVRVDNPTPGIYVVKQGSKVTKQVIR